MGVFSKYHRYREAGEDVNINNAAKFGQPVKSLFTSAKIFSLKQQIDVTDEREVPVYQAKSKFFSIKNKTDVTTASGEHVSHIEKKIFTLHERHYVTMADGLKFEISNEIFHLIKDITNIEGLGWQLRGNIAALNFELYDGNNEIIATISQKMLSLHDKYCIDLYKAEYEKIVVTILIALEHMMKDREASQASASSISFDN